MTKHYRIGFFDSGIGGLSVLRHAPRLLSEQQYLYVADSAFAPYGNLTPEQVRERSMRIALFLIEQRIDALVVACNTATAVAVEQLRAAFSIPVIAMEPAIKPSVQSSRNKRIGVLATATTLDSERYLSLKQRYLRHPDTHIEEAACHHWVEWVENRDLQDAALHSDIAADIAPFEKANVDTLVLACTHFPFLSEAIAAHTKADLIDPAPAVINQLGRVLGIESEAEDSDKDRLFRRPENLQLYGSGDVEVLRQQVKALLGWDFSFHPLPF